VLVLDLLYSKYIQFINNSPKVNEVPALTGFAYPLDDIDFKLILANSKLEEKTFLYWNLPGEEFSFLGIDALHTIDTENINPFQSLEDQLHSSEFGHLNNFEEHELTNVPLYLGGMKFNDREEDNTWSDYRYSEWFIPKLIYLKSGEKYFLIINIMVMNKDDNPAVELNKILNYHSDLTDTKYSKYYSPVIIDKEINDKEKWDSNIIQALEKISANEFNKIVLSRKVELKFENEFSFANHIEQLENENGKGYIFAFKKFGSIFFGASPERLLKISKGTLKTDALAGSIPRGKTGNEDSKLAEKLLNDPKSILEHNTVVKFIIDALSDNVDEVTFQENPGIKKLTRIQHLWTPIFGKLKKGVTPFSILKKLHPTPAVCGAPREISLKNIYNMEEHSRGLYSGIIGWFNDDEAEFSVALRSALAKGNKIYAFAGCGIVEGSNPNVEFEESELKLKPILSLFEK